MSYLRKAEIKNVIQYFCNELSSQTIQKVIERCNFNEFTRHNFLWILQEILHAVAFISTKIEVCLVQLKSPRRKYGIRNHHQFHKRCYIKHLHHRYARFLFERMWVQPNDGNKGGPNIPILIIKDVVCHVCSVPISPKPLDRL